MSVQSVNGLSSRMDFDSSLPKLIIQIPCYNEEKTLGITLAELPRQIDGIGAVEWLIIDDGSKDRTVEVAIQHGVDHIVSIGRNRGLANAFTTGLRECLKRGADIIVNTDADNQYCAADIPALVAPILRREADIVIGSRPITTISHFSPIKKMLQKLGSGVVRLVSGATVQDAPSGFRAISREAALQVNIFSRYTYTLEMIIQAGQRGSHIISVPIRVNGDLRPSRLVKSIRSYVSRSAQTIVRIFVLYRPFRFFAFLGCVPFTLGMILAARWVWLMVYEYPITRQLHISSLVIAAILILAGVQAWGLAFVADLLRANRMILEEIRYYARKNEFGKSANEELSAERNKYLTMTDRA